MIYKGRYAMLLLSYAILQSFLLYSEAHLRHQMAEEPELERHISDYYYSTAIMPLLKNNSCISTDRQLRDAVTLAPSPSDPKAKPLLIKICRALVLINPTITVKGVTGIDLSNRYIDLRCNISANQRCILNAQGKSRIFYGNNTKLIVTGTDFVNASMTTGDPMKVGSALTFGQKSDITLNQCFLLSNKGKVGSGVAMDQSTLFMKGNADKNKMVVKDNTGSVVSLKLTTAKLVNVKFVKNTVDLGALKSDQSKISLMNCTFYNNNDDVVGSDIYIVDDKAPASGGTFVSCDGTKNTFCDGTGNLAINDSPTKSNTNCKTKGIVGKPGVGVCVL